MASRNLNPLIYWAQTDSQISIKVDLKDVKEYSVKTEDNCKLNFKATGVGALGLNEYKFSLDLYEQFDSDAIKTMKTDSKIDIFIPKLKNGFWPRLICQPQKPNFLKIDFDRWQVELDDEDEDEKARDILKDYPNMMGQVEKEELGFRREQGRMVYLIFYNLFQFIGFMYIILVMAIRYSRDGPKSMEGTYEAVGNSLKFVQLIQYLEVMHPIFGYTKGGATFPFFQITGRNFILFAMIESEPRMQTKPVVFYLIGVWSLVEIIRYPYYLSTVMKKEISLLTWLRYTIWIPLYPLGILFEGVVILRNIPYFEETQRFTVSLPNRFNFTFNMPIFMYIYLIMLILPGTYLVMTNMQKLRAKKLRSKKMV